MVRHTAKHSLGRFQQGPRGAEFFASVPRRCVARYLSRTFTSTRDLLRGTTQSFLRPCHAIELISHYKPLWWPLRSQGRLAGLYPVSRTAVRPASRSTS